MIKVFIGYDKAPKGAVLYMRNRQLIRCFLKYSHPYPSSNWNDQIEGLFSTFSTIPSHYELIEICSTEDEQIAIETISNALEVVKVCSPRTIEEYQDKKDLLAFI